MPVELGSFDVIIGMDWLRYHAVIVCDEKLVQIPYGNETLTFCGKKSSNGRESRLTVISCSKAQEYMAKGCQVFLAHISTKKEEDKSERKQIEDVPIVRDFPEVFPKDLPGLPPARPVEFQIDLIPGVALVARAPYRLAPSEMKELSEQLQELSDKGFIRPSSLPWGAPVLFVKKKDVVTDDIPEPAQEEAVEVTYKTLEDLVQRFHDHTKEIPICHFQLERDNIRLRDMMDVASQRVARSQRRELRVQKEI
ncbi:hypothetical protein Tco_0134944 [Tanacetum coccineum]